MENLAGIAAFVKAVATGSIAEAARALEISAPAVSKSIKTLEKSLGVRLLNRTTRKLTPTDEGMVYFERLKPLLEQMQDASAEVREALGSSRGTLRVSATVGFGRQCIVPLLPEFARDYPGVQIDLHLDDTFSDFVTDRVDIAIRNGRLADRNVVARRIAPMRFFVCGSPDYFAEHGKPKRLEDLAQHNCINFRLAATGRVYRWEFEEAGEPLSVSVKGNLILNSAEAQCFSAVAGAGLAQLGAYLAIPHIRTGALIPVLTEYGRQGRGHWLLYLERRHRSRRLQVFADFICKRVPEVFDFEP